MASMALHAQDAGDPLEGEALFKANCAACHAKNMKDNLTGPALGGVEERWAEYPREDLYSWIRNSQKLIASGHPRAKALWEEWGVIMSPYPNLTDAQMDNILLYINNVYTAGCAAPPCAVEVAETAADGPQESGNNMGFYILLAALLSVLAIVLARIVANLDYLSKVREGEEATRRTFLETLTSRGIIGFAVFALVVFGGYTTVNNAIMLGRQQGYQPEQPINFSHEIHSGIHKIDCQYCHDGARRSKHSVIPATNTCMNCHRAIKYGSNWGTKELTKIYAAIGFNPLTDKYFEDYAELPEDSLATVFQQWIREQYLSRNSDDPNAKVKVDEVVAEQWSGIVKALKDPNDPNDKIQGPVEWVRLHNLPDHAYFNHAQHVSVGGLECQTCHGPVEEMPVVYQYSPLSMGWCINCHRQTEVQFTDNAYYESYQNYHEEIKTGKRSKVTVEDIGGLECQKCHY